MRHYRSDLFNTDYEGFKLLKLMQLLLLRTGYRRWLCIHGQKAVVPDGALASGTGGHELRRRRVVLPVLSSAK